RSTAAEPCSDQSGLRLLGAVYAGIGVPRSPRLAAAHFTQPWVDIRMDQPGHLPSRPWRELCAVKTSGTLAPAPKRGYKVLDPLGLKPLCSTRHPNRSDASGTRAAIRTGISGGRA